MKTRTKIGLTTMLIEGLLVIIGGLLYLAKLDNLLWYYMTMFAFYGILSFGKAIAIWLTPKVTKRSSYSDDTSALDPIEF